MRRLLPYLPRCRGGAAPRISSAVSTLHRGLGHMTDTTAVDRFPFISGGSDMAAMIRAFDWSRTPLGDIDGWPDTLKMARR